MQGAEFDAAADRRSLSRSAPVRAQMQRCASSSWVVWLCDAAARRRAQRSSCRVQC